MKTINIELTKKSIANAIKALENYKKNMPTMVEEYLWACCEYIDNKAMKFLLSSDIGTNVVEEIINSRKIVVSKNSAKLTYGGKAAFIEFGVGYNGKDTYSFDINPLLQAEWQYDIETGKKLHDRSWIFNVNDEDDIDISPKNIIKATENTVRTRGNQAVSFVYKAIIDFKTTGAYKVIWERVKEKYIK